MNALSLIKPFVKPILWLLLILCIFMAWKYHNALQQKIGSLDQTIEQNKKDLNVQKQQMTDLNNQVKLQSKAITDLQERQSYLSALNLNRQNRVKEVLNVDSNTKTWASQSVPDSIRSLFNNTKQVSGTSSYEQYLVPTANALQPESN